MTQPSPDRRHFIRAVTELGENRRVVTTQAIVNTRGVKIVEAGVAVNTGLYERLMQHQLDRPLEDSVDSIPAVDGRLLRDSAEAHLKSFGFFTHVALDEESRRFLLDMTERLPLPGPIAFQLTLAHEVQPELYQHSVVSALVAAWLAKTSRLSQAQVTMAAAGGLLHDLGLLHLDPVLLSFRKKIDEAQRRQLYSHPLVSTILIERHPEFGAEVVRGVREHHEFLDGSGYPVGLAGDQISQIGKILALTELIVGSFAPDRSAPAQRLSVQLRMNTHRYDEPLVDMILRVLRPQSDEKTPAPLVLLKNPIKDLLSICEALNAWPAGLDHQLAPSDHRRQVVANMNRQISQLQRTLARVGVTPEQLAQLDQLGTEAVGSTLQTELTLLAREAAWQLGTLARDIRRHMRPQSTASDCPPPLKAWVERIDRIADGIAGPLPADQDRMAREEQEGPL